MKTKILLPAIVLILLSGIGAKALAATADVRLRLELDCAVSGECAPAEERENDYFSPALLNSGAEFKVNVLIDNPSAQPLVSVQAWLNYNPDKLEGVKVETFDNFGLVAPGEKEFDVNNGRVKIGVANTSGGILETAIVLATITFRVKSEEKETIPLTFYDYQVSELGHTNVNIIEDSFPLNVLATPPKALVLNLNGKTTMASATDLGGSPVLPVSPRYASLVRPTGLKITTGNGYAYLAWEVLPGLGYNIYYSNQSGNYLHKMDVGLSNSFYVTNLNNDQTYYFAITAYDTSGNESDYSDEVAIIINHPETSTSPLIVGAADITASKSGPSSVLGIALLAGTLGYILSRKYGVANKIEGNNL